MKKSFLILFSFIVIALMSRAEASLLLEPVVGYNAPVHVDVDNLKNFTSGRGGSIGGRVGYQALGFQLGLDYLKSAIDMNSSSFKSDLKMEEWAGFVGFEFPVLLRVYAGYIFSAQGTSSFNDSTLGRQDLKLTGGTGSKLGVGFTALPFLDINFEYRRGSFDDYKLGSTKVNNKVNYSAFMVGVSLPFNI
jgi:hypothetical protein